MIMLLAMITSYPFQNTNITIYYDSNHSSKLVVFFKQKKFFPSLRVAVWFALGDFSGEELGLHFVNLSKPIVGFFWARHELY